jgi:hypothetical protein
MALPVIHDHRLEIIQVQRLEEVIVEACGSGMDAILFGAVAAYRDEHHVA